VQPFDVSAVVTGVVELYEPVAEERGCSLSLRTEPGLTLAGNRELVGQVVANLLDNALKYGMKETEGGNAVDVATRREGADIVIEIADRGPGIDEGDRKRVLERFVRLEGARSQPGSGLGLSLAAAVARMHGGSLSLDDNTPGLKVTLRLPSGGAAG